VALATVCLDDLLLAKMTMQTGLPLGSPKKNFYTFAFRFPSDSAFGQGRGTEEIQPLRFGALFWASLYPRGPRQLPYLSAFLRPPPHGLPLCPPSSCPQVWRFPAMDFERCLAILAQRHGQVGAASLTHDDPGTRRWAECMVCCVRNEGAQWRVRRS
jgi:hypothetical protein